MVTIVDFAERESADGRKFYALIIQGGVEMVLSEESGRYYLTARQASVTSTFNEQTCKELILKQLPGKVAKISAEPYEYTIKETGEVITLNHRWAYSPDDAPVEEVIWGSILNSEKGSNRLYTDVKARLKPWQQL